ncbi:hypothetical protein [Streptomyces sp. NPDC015350]|uniref:hypothetical protein n=1 Tax=Streptomyces sp. NPDC015350 TaxID=3364955 RepID=UPI003701FCB9
MSRQQVLIVVVLLLVLTWSAVMAALGYAAAIATLVPSLLLAVQQVVHATRTTSRSGPAPADSPEADPPAAVRTEEGAR